MRMISRQVTRGGFWSSALFGVLLLVACSASPLKQVQPSDKTPDSPFAPNDIKHQQSGLILPSVVGLFNQVAVAHFNADGSDLAVKYGHPDNPDLLITVFVFPTPRATNNEYLSLTQNMYIERETLKRGVFNTREIPKSEIKTQRLDRSWVPIKPGGEAAVFDMRGQNSLTTLLALYDYDGWRLKFRVTFKNKTGQKSLENIAQFSAAFQHQQWRYTHSQ